MWWPRRAPLSDLIMFARRLIDTSKPGWWDEVEALLALAFIGCIVLFYIVTISLALCGPPGLKLRARTHLGSCKDPVWGKPCGCCRTCHEEQQHNPVPQDRATTLESPAITQV